jgi:hypothetical protein
VYLPNTNTNTNTSTQTNTNTLTRFNTNTNTNTSTATNTSTSTNTSTTTSSVTQTYGTDDNNDGVLQASELNADGSGTDFLWTDATELAENNGVGTNGNGYYDQVIEQTIEQMIVQGDSTLSFYNPESGLTTFGDGNIITQEISQDVWSLLAEWNEGNNTVLNESVVNYESVTPDGGGWYEIEMLDITQVFDQQIVQDVFYEKELIQDFTQTQDISQSYYVDEIRTATATRLVSE